MKERAHTVWQMEVFIRDNLLTIYLKDKECNSGLMGRLMKEVIEMELNMAKAHIVSRVDKCTMDFGKTAKNMVLVTS